MKRNLLVAILIIITCFFSQIAYGTDETLPIGNISVSGNLKIDTETVLTYVKTKPGEGFSPAKIRQDIQAVYKSGFFRDVQVDAKAVEGKLDLTFIVKEKPAIKEIALSGNDELSEEKIRKVIDLTVNSVLDEVALEKNVELIRKRYAEDGFYLAKVVYELTEETADSVKITFKIEEGEEINIEKIDFTGNQAYDDDELADVIETTEHWFLSWLTGSGYLKQEELDADMDRLLAFYYDRGYIQANIGDPQIKLNEVKTKLTITIPVEEGLQFTISEIKYAGNKIIETSQIKEKVISKAGEIFNRSSIRKDADTVSSLYADQGYLLTQVYPSTEENIENKTVKVTFNVNEGDMTYAGKITISGNTSTRDKVIRRELQFVEGDVLTGQKMRRSYERLNNLGFFEKVDLETKKSADKGTLDLDLNVKERLTGTISLGAGYSSVNKVVGNASISQGNLFGRGQNLSLSASVGKVIQDYTLSFTEPWLFDIPLSAGIDVYSNTRRRFQYSQYQVDRKGLALPFSYALSDYTKAYFTYRYELVDIHDLPDNAISAFKKQEGKSTTSSTYYALVRDSRDNRFRPTNGSRNKVSYEVAGGPFGGDNYYQRYVGESGWHFPLFWKFVFSINGKIGYENSFGGKEIPVQELFTAGGAQTVRSFNYGELGPKQEGQVIGGNKLMVFNFEINFPIVDPLAGVIFYDMGNAYAEGVNYQFNNLRTGIGAGIRFFTPMGPIRLDWGYKLDRLPGESPSQWHFAMGTYF